MKFTLKEMNGLLNGKCLPSDLIVGETLAEYLVRKFAALEQQLAESQREFRSADATIENLQMQVEKLAAENALLKKSEPAPFSKLMMEALDVYQDGADEVPELAMLSAYKKLRDGLKTPATDDFLAEVRASALHADVMAAIQKVARIRLDLNELDGDKRGIIDCLSDAEESLIEVVNRFAAQLRQGGAA